MTDFGFLKGLKPLFRPIRFVGNAVTVRIPHMDSSILHKALETIQPGDVIVVDMSGDTERACWGEIVNYAARVKKVEGVVIGGCITDFQPLLEQRVPIFSLGISPLTTRILGIEGELNTVISVCGVSVHPGDLVVADDDGVFVVNPSAAVDYAIRALKKQESEIETKRKLDAGISLASISGSQRFFE
jgi:regulator of RNase E activity RraA